jgi:hypothetical protein
MYLNHSSKRIFTKSDAAVIRICTRNKLLPYVGPDT